MEDALHAVTVFVTKLYCSEQSSCIQQMLLARISHNSISSKCGNGSNNLMLWIWGLHSGVAEDWGLLEHDTVSLGECFLTFWRIIVPRFKKCQDYLAQRHSIKCQKSHIFNFDILSLKTKQLVNLIQLGFRQW